MHFDKAFCAQTILQDGAGCNETFSKLLKEISELPQEMRGIKALKMSAFLVEVAAYELAGKLDSSEVGALIHCSAELSERSSELTTGRPKVRPQMTHSIQ